MFPAFLSLLQDLPKQGIFNRGEKGTFLKLVLISESQMLPVLLSSVMNRERNHHACQGNTPMTLKLGWAVCLGYHGLTSAVQTVPAAFDFLEDFSD